MSGETQPKRQEENLVISKAKSRENGSYVKYIKARYMKQIDVHWL